MRFLFVLSVLCALCGLRSLSFALEREAFTITGYELNIDLDSSQHRLGARGKVTLRNDSARAQKVAVLQISSSLNWRAIKIEGKTVQYVSQSYVSDIDHTGALSEAIITLSSGVKPKDYLEIVIAYEGVIPLDTTRLTRIGVPDDIAKHSSWDEISPSFTAVRGAGYVAWYPIATESADFSEGNSLFEVTDRWKAREAQSSMEVNLCTQPDDSIEAKSVPGLVPEIIMNERPRSPGSAGGDDHRACRAFQFHPLRTVIPTFIVAGYVSKSKGALNLLSLPGDEDGASTYANALDPAVKFVETWFGSPATITIADFADSRSTPFEGGTLLLASMAAEDSRLAGINLVHELVHSALPSSRPWVFEGLAHFAEAMYRQQQGGRQAALEYLAVHRPQFLDSEKEVSIALQKNSGQKVGQALVSTFDETYSRSKAAYVWWMLRDMVGDEPLKQAIHSYRADDDNNPKYVEQLVEAASKRDLGWFFEDWVYQDRGLPDIRVQSVHPWKTEKNVQMITVTLENRSNAGAEIPFTIVFEGGQVTKRLEVRARSTATTRVELPFAASEITLSDGSVPELDMTGNSFKIPPQP